MSAPKTSNPGLSAEAESFFGELPFKADEFQLEAVRIFEAGQSVVVTAPTGSGKTLIAEAAVRLITAAGKRAFYTAPIKALSNQKFGDFRRAYGQDKVGLLTGDNSINGEAPIVVMTTEVLRNMIYAESDAIEDLGVVILDEVHYLQDPYRGSVWEEVIIHLPQAVQLVNLSATIANATEFTDWVRARRGKAALVVETHRPVPLESTYMLVDKHREHRLEIWPVFANGARRPNPDVIRVLRRGKGRGRRFGTPRRLEVAESLQAEQLLPAIYFIFSRIGCEEAASRVAAASLDLVTPDAAATIRKIAEARTAHLPPEDLAVLGYGSWSEMLSRGVAAHHAGMVPSFKEVVEELFAGGLIKLVFATETLALGINMPARTVVIEKLSKFTGDGHELLQPGDYTQLTGRAGRRGIDIAGTAVVLHTQFVPFDKVAAIAASGSHMLVSSFRPSYNMAVNLVANYPQERAEELLNASFAQFRLGRRKTELARAVAEKAVELAEIRRSAECERGDIWAFLAQHPDAGSHRDAMARFAQDTQSGDVIRLDADDDDYWVLLARGYGSHPRLLLLSITGEVRRVRPSDLPVSATRLGSVELPEPFRPRDTGYQRATVRKLRAWSPEDDAVPLGAADDHPFGDDAVGSCPDLPNHRTWARRAERAERDLKRLRRRSATEGAGLVRAFRRLLGLLDGMGYVDGWELSPKGERLRYVYNELDLLLAESAERGHLDQLDAAGLAAVATLFTYEARRNDVRGSWPDRTTANAGEAVMDLADELNRLEADLRVVETRYPDSGFAEAAYYWATGSNLEDLFESDDFAAGDFVRNCRQLLDLLRQLRDTYPSLKGTATEAVRRIDRGVVAAGGAW